MNPLYRILYTVCLLYLFNAVHAQEIPVNEYGLEVIDEIALYLATVEHDSAKRLVDLGEFIPSIVQDIKYATEDNFTGRQLYPYPGAFLRYPAAVALRNVQEELKESVDRENTETQRLIMPEHNFTPDDGHFYCNVFDCHRIDLENIFR
jgi:hypothetical protein